MTKEEVSQRVLQNGKPLSLDKFNWDEETKTFSTKESYLVVDFFGIDNCTFNAGHGCTLNAGHSCSFKTGSECVVVRRGIFEVIMLEKNKKITLCPYGIKGYIDGDKKIEKESKRTKNLIKYYENEIKKNESNLSILREELTKLQFKKENKNV